MSCKACSIFLYDFLLTGTPKELHISKKIREKNLKTCSVELSKWILHIHEKLPQPSYEKALRVAKQITERLHKDNLNDPMFFRTTYNMLHYNVSWLGSETEFIKVILIESNLFEGRDIKMLHHIAREYLEYILPKSLFFLHVIHNDHLHPKGLRTNIDSLIPKKKKEVKKTKTLHDPDDYQREVLEEKDDDLYF